MASMSTRHEIGKIDRLLELVQFTEGHVYRLHYCRTDLHCRSITASCSENGSDNPSLSVRGLTASDIGIITASSWLEPAMILSLPVRYMSRLHEKLHNFLI
jgi:hypothetical protein